MPSSAATRALGLAASLGGIGTTAGAGAIVIGRGNDWYRRLDKPRWAIPGVAFAPAWSLIASAQAIGAWLAWRADDERDSLDVPAVSSYAAQLWLSLAWTLLFFGLKRPAYALVEISALWLAIVLTIREYARRHRFAAAWFLPSLAGVAYVAALNTAIWRRSRRD
ncbi:MAG TPA: TspO/MBR family protein [Mycobacteriales bacterium]|jgi:tryptophan-rich sensory protein|nr:TspO/MBR family protein [Mycobacteriales bacterium]